jgi:peptide/nickel transport system substrate-binding protein
VAESTTQRQMLEAGEVDFADGLSYDSVTGLKKNPNVKIIAMPSVWNIMLMLNTQRSYLSDVRVRQAISYAINYQDVLTVGSHGFAQQSAGPLPRNVYPHDPALQPYPYDIQKAKELMAEAGYPNGGFKLLMTIQSDEQWAPKFAPLIKEALGRIGIDVTVQPMLFTQLWEKAKGPTAQRQDIMELLWWPGFPDGYDTLYSCFHSEAEPYWNLAYWYDETYDRLIDDAFRLEATDPEKAQELYNQAQQMLVDQAPAVYLFDPQAIFGVLTSLKLDSGALNPWYTAAFFWYQSSK